MCNGKGEFGARKCDTHDAKMVTLRGFRRILPLHFRGMSKRIATAPKSLLATPSAASSARHSGPEGVNP